MNKKAVYLLLILVVFVLYGNSIKNKYALDDHLVNQKNELTQHGIKGIPAIFCNYSFSENNIIHEYRPVLLTSFAIEYSLFGTHPHTSHFINVLLYAFLIVLVYRFCLLAFSGNGVEVLLLAVLLFLVHPLHAEMVNNIKSRDEILVALFGFSAWIQYLHYLNDKRSFRLILLFLFLLLGFLSKQSMLMYFVILPFLHFYFCKEKHWLRMLKVISVMLLAYGFVILLKSGLPDNDHAERIMLFYENPLVGTSYVEKFFAAMSISLFNMKLLVWPFPLSYYYGYNTVDISSVSMMVGGMAMFLVLIFCMVRNNRKDLLISFALLFILINLAATSNFFVLLPGIVGERFLLLGSLGVCLLISKGLVVPYKRAGWTGNTEKVKFKWVAIILSAALILIPASKVFQRNKTWKDEFTLISTDVENRISSVKANDLYVNQIMTRIRTERNQGKKKAYVSDALKHASISVCIDPYFVTGWNNLGLLYLSEGEFSKAEVCMRKAVSLARKKEFAQYMFNLAVIYETKKDLDVAHEAYKIALVRDPATPNLIPVYKQFVLKNGRAMEAILFLKGILNEEDGQYELYLLMTDLYMNIDQPKLALFYVKTANQMQPSEKLAEYIEKITTFIKDNSK